MGLAVQHELQRYDRATGERLEAVVGAITVPAKGIMLRSGDGIPVASAFAVADGIAYAMNVVTAASARRKGYGRAVMQGGLAWAVEAGARYAALNVQADNPAGLALYASVGYTYVYDYHYCRPVA